jgi:hypothetical protein
MSHDRRRRERRSGVDRRSNLRGPERRRRERRGLAAGLLLFASLSLPPRASAGVQNGPGAYRALIEKAAGRYNVNPKLVEAVIHVESAFVPTAVSRKGARGLMQLMPDTARRFGVRDVFDPEQNIRGGTRYLSVLLRLFRGDIDLACAAYNSGENTVRRFGGIPPYRETRSYVAKIRRLLGLTEGAVHLASAAPRPPQLYYTWTDDSGILNVSQFPPGDGRPYKIFR